MNKKINLSICVLLVFVGVILGGKSAFNILAKSMERNLLDAEHKISGQNTDYQVVDLGGITNWVVVTNHSSPGGVYKVVTKGLDSNGNPILGCGFNGKEIPVGTQVRFICLFSEPIHGAGYSHFHFVEPLK